MNAAGELMLLVIGLLSAVLVVLWLVLPLVSWLRTSQVKREVAALQARLTALEAALAQRRDAPATGAPSVAPAAPDASIVRAPVAAPPVSPPPYAVPVLITPPPPPPPAAVPDMATASASNAVAAEEIPENSLEEAIGGRLMLWAGAIVLVLGVAFFLKYAFDNEWITESMRIVLGVAAGLGLVAAGERFTRRGYNAYGQIVTGGGLAVLFLAIYAAFSFYGLIGRTTAFALLVLTTAAAAALADRQRAVGLALMAVGGGFATPFLVGGSTDAQLTLFTYDALLVVGTLYLANRQDWPSLNALSFTFTVLTIAAWAVEYYTPAKWLRTELFLTLFCVLFLLILRAQLARHGWRRISSLALATGPLLYHAASLAVLVPQGVPVLVYLIAVTVVTVALAVRAESAAWRLAAWAAVALPLLAWVESHQSERWLVPNIVTAAAVFALHALAQIDRVLRLHRPLGAADHALQHANGYVLLGLLYAAVELVWLAVAPALSLGVAAVHAAVTARLWRVDRRAALHALAVAVGAVTVALTIQLDGRWLTMALGVEGALVVALGLALDEPWFRRGGAALLASAVMRYVLLSLPETPAVFHPIANEAFAMGLALAGIIYALAWAYRRSERGAATEILSGTTAAVMVASILVVIACSAHNDAYWSLEGDLSADARFASSLALSAIWTALASAFIGVGMLRAFPPLRYLAMALFGLTVLKVFLVDLSSLGGIYRILGFIGVGLVLLAVSFLYQRGRVKRSAAEPRNGSATGTQSSQS